MINSFHPAAPPILNFPAWGHGLDMVLSKRASLEAIREHEHGPFDRDFSTRWLIE
jgi:hypothetical protein